MLSFPRMMSRDIRPWVRLFEDLEASSNGSGHHHSGHPSSLFRSNMSFPSTFTPSFDVKETKDSYVLDGDLPGITDKSALDLSFVDDNTLVVKGRIERSSETGNPQSEAATPAAEKREVQASGGEEAGESSNASGEKYWVRERYVGEFQRAFSFPQSVDHEAVKASLKDGILSITVPKKTGPDGPRKITIE